MCKECFEQGIEYPDLKVNKKTEKSLKEFEDYARVLRERRSDNAPKNLQKPLPPDRF